MSLLSRLAVQAARAYGILSSKAGVSASYLVVAGGAGGGGATTNQGGGGGGAGGLLASTATLSTLTTYTVTVGAGGTGGTYGGSAATNGANSVISGTGLSTITSTGGGAGGVGPDANGSNGGSGGGGGSGGTLRTGGTGTVGQGNNGGQNNGSSPFAAGGGGGAGAVGGDGGSVGNGNGGNGSASSISGSSVTYAGGGGAGKHVSAAAAGTGGTGGGGAGGSSSAGTAGTVNLGGGGGGGSSNNVGGAGGSGVVIISYTSATPRFVGGTLTTSGGNQIHTFTSSGTLSPLTPVTASYLVVAGGGGGGGDGGGGGGAGGLQTGSTTIYSGATYLVTVGAGASGGVGSSNGSSGSNSVLSGTGLTTITSTGGGGGGRGVSGSGLSGGSGGGGGMRNALSGGAGTSGQGNNGGTGSSGTGDGAAGGGGGSSAVGGSASGTKTAGNGGAGTASSISGSSVTYAGGGGGSTRNFDGTYTNGTGGAGGGGNGALQNAAAGSGTTNLGGGGGGGDSNSSGNGGVGGSGTVIISYAGSQQFNGGLVTSSGGNTIHTFNATGALTPLTNNLTNSLRFRASASAYLNRTPTVAGNTQKWTLSQWTKRGTLGVNQVVETSRLDGSNFTRVEFLSGDTLQIWSVVSSVAVIQLVSTQVFRDPSAWYHIVVAVDTTQATAANRVKLYINGNQVTAFSTATYPSQNASSGFWNQVQLHEIAAYSASTFYDGYLTDIYNIDGQALEPYYFGNNDANGVWKPIKYTGMYGTNGFYLTFADTSALTTSSNVGLGKDTSGNGNYWATNNISITADVTYDAMLDVPTNTSATVANYATLNPLQVASATLSNANLSMVRSATGYGETSSTFSPEGNKGYFEITRSSTGDHLAGFILNSISPSTNNYTASGSYWYQCDTGNVRYGTGGSTATLITGCTSAPTGSQIIMVAFDFTGGNRNVWFGLQGTWGVNASSQTGVPSTGAFPHLTTTQLTDICRLYFSNGDTNAFSINFGQRPFSYTPPSGFVALNTFNLPTPTILQGRSYMDATLYTGTGTSQVIVNQALFKPDFVWLKARSTTTNHRLYDSVRGATLHIQSNATNAETTNTDGLTAFGSNGFTVGSASSENASGQTFVGWQWQAGQGSTTTGTGTGGITSVTQSVNATAGFSVVIYTGSGSVGTVTHGLGVAPKMIIVKNRDAADAWQVYHAANTANPETDYLVLNTTAATADAADRWNDTLPTSTVFSIGNGVEVNTNTEKYVAYCWAEIAGFSKFGSYTGNGSTDGVFVNLGFRPKFILLKGISTAEDWYIHDSTRNTYNVVDLRIEPNSSLAEVQSAVTVLDFLSNGFKLRTSNGGWNGSGSTYIYAAYAENPFKNSNAR